MLLEVLWSAKPTDLADHGHAFAEGGLRSFSSVDDLMADLDAAEPSKR